MAMPKERVLSRKPLRKPKAKRSSLLSNTTPERLAKINKLSERDGGLSNLTYERVFGKE
ncbi:hypothetical protein [Alkalicoccobacillus gibsonii]|uniref:hypothetical protein n=1 Tax=Alkalicoccobacillus gibsonii TaxID=79881 RepID=UPI0019344ABF|nr:hypothetical protein [Alkalicoccobacillus gibsonii]MBM0064794.1 hypothetical protein [Alkalicoccobacillus gibsonii]